MKRWRKVYHGSLVRRKLDRLYLFRFHSLVAQMIKNLQAMQETRV